MSAHKSAIVKLGEAEYQRLREAEEKLRLHELVGSSGSIDFEQASIYERMLEQGKKSSIRFNEVVNRLEQEYVNQAAIQEETTQWVYSQNQALQKKLFQTEKAASNWVNQVAQELSQRENQLEQRIQLQNELALGKKHADQEDSRIEIERAIELLGFLQQEYLFDLDSANELEVHRSEIEESQSQFEAGRDERAWMAARNALNGLIRLRHHLEGQRAATTACQIELLSSTKKVVDLIQKNVVVQAMDADGNEIPDQIDVDYWTEGAYQKLVNQSVQAENAVCELEGNDLNELSEWHEEIKMLDERALDLVTQARLAVIASQLRFNVAQIVVKALETQGFYLEEAAYHQNDFRASFMARTRSLSGSEVLVTIDPDPGLDEGGRVHIQSEDAQPVTEHELLQRNQEIFQAIRQQGLQVGETKQVNPKHLPLKPLRTQLQTMTRNRPE